MQVGKECAMLQEPKYLFEAGKVINRASGEVIPSDEPVFVLRGRDIHAVALLESYLEMVNDPDHLEAVVQRIKQFAQFRRDHPERMKEPATLKDAPAS